MLQEGKCPSNFTDTDQSAPSEESHQGLSYLQFCSQFSDRSQQDKLVELSHNCCKWPNLNFDFGQFYNFFDQSINSFSLKSLSINLGHLKPLIFHLSKMEY